MNLVDYADGSYSTSDDGGRGDIFALTPRIYPVPEYLSEYYDLAKALRVATNTCALQHGVCWVVRRDKTLPRNGQRCGSGECNWRGENSPGMSGLAGVPVAVATESGLAVVQGGAVMPLWRRIYQNTGADHFIVQGPSQTYSAAVKAAMVIADRTKQQRLVYGWGRDGKPVPMIYTHPGGLVRSATPRRDYETQVTRMDDFELRQAIAASSGASIMPFGM